MKKQTKNQLSTITVGYRKRQRRYVFTALTLLFLTLLLACIMMVCGNTVYSPKTVLRVLSGENVEDAVFTIKTLRLPRMLTAILCGLAFGMAGNTFQQLLGNPLASPDIIGVTSGASVAAVFGILVLKLDGGTVSLMAVFSGLLVSALIYFLSQGGGFSNARLILTGIGMQAFLSAVISWMLLKASEYDVANALRWLSGSLNGVKLENVPRLTLVVFGAGGAILLLNRQLSMLLALLLVAFATSVTGPVASVAFLSGPIATRLSGNGKNGMLTSALTGSTLVLASDLIGQFALPSRYPVGVVTGILGAPYLLFLLLQMNDKGEHV